MRRSFLIALGALSLATTATAQTVRHYWDFTTTADVVGGVPTSAVGSADLSLHPTYGEAYSGSGASLNSVLGGTGSGGGFLEAAVVSGGSLQMDWGAGSFSFSFWTWDDFAADGDTRGPRVFDNLDSTAVGIQLGTNLANDWNLRVDDDNGDVLIFNNVSPFQLPRDRWVHVVGVVDRGASMVRAYVDGTLQAEIPFNDGTSGSPMTGNVFPTIDMQIGVINGGTNAGQSQTSGLDDLAFYEGVLGAADAAGLANGTLTPLDFAAGIGTTLCAGEPNSVGAGATLAASGSDVAGDNDLTLTVEGLPTSAMSLGYFVTSQESNTVVNPGGSEGTICIASYDIGRHDDAVLDSGGTGTVAFSPDLTALPRATGPLAVTAGETHYWQYWYRDSDGAGQPTSNFSGAVCITFQ